VKLVISAAARLEEREAAAWYRAKNPNLPKRFRAELKIVLGRVATTPRQFPVIVDDYRQALLSVFPYAVIFEIADKTILVIAIAHLSRFPAYWLDLSNKPTHN
jgi:hypothetical protein